MKSKKLFTSLAAAVMLSAGLAGSGAVMSQNVSAASTTQTASTTTKSSNSSISIKGRSVSAVVNNNNPKLYAVEENSTSITPIDSNYTKGQTIQVYFSMAATMGGQPETLYYVKSQTTNGKTSMVLIPASDVTTSSTVPTYEAYTKQMESDVKAIQDAYNNRAVKSIKVTAKSKKGAKIYYAYAKSKKSKKVYFKASKKKIKYGKKYTSSSIVKNGKTRYVYIGKKRYIKASALKIVSVKYAAVKLSDDLKNLIVEN